MARTVNENDGYRERLLKAIPSEVVAAYLAANGAILSFETPPGWLHWVVFGIFLAGVPLWLILFQGVKSVLQNVLSGIGFIVWAMTIPGPFTTLSGYKLGYGSVILIVYSALIAPLLGKLIKE